MSLTLIILSTISFFINLIFHFYKKKGYNLLKFRVFLVFIFIIYVIFFIRNLPFFLFIDSNIILKAFNQFIIKITTFNLSVIFIAISLVFHLLSYSNRETGLIDLEIPSYTLLGKGDIKIGTTIKRKSRKHNFYLSIKDLEKHMFICGSTGTGKSNFLQNFLINYKKKYDTPFFLVEFKGEYHFLQEKIEDLIIIWPGENFSINIFNPEGADPKIHAERIFDILKTGQFLDENSEYSPQMEKVLIEILTKVCEKKNFQNWEGFEKNCEKYVQKNRNSIPMLKQTIISIKNRIRRFSEGPLKAVFEKNTNIAIKDLFNLNVILDLSSIIRLGGEKEDAMFFLNMILKYLWDKNITNGASNYCGIKHITIIEDAQYFAPQNKAKKSKLTTYLEDIALLQRGTGECLITLATRPDISKEILANNGVVLTFKNHIEKDIMCELLNLDNEKKSYLSFLEEGQCIIRVNSIKEPFLLLVPYYKRKTLTVSEIMKRNRKVLENLNIIKRVDDNLKNKRATKISWRIKLKKVVKALRSSLINRVRFPVNSHDKKILLQENSEIGDKKITQNCFQQKIFRSDNKESDLKQFKELINDLYRLEEKKY
ncbi:MAG: ATP-binding protein [Promethearchaeota archaeon]